MKENIDCYYPVYEKITIRKIEYIIEIFSFKNDLMVLSSSRIMKDYGNYSFVCFDSFGSFLAKDKNYFWNNERIETNNPFDFINSKMDEYKIQKNVSLPPLQGGIVGYFGYEANHYLEDLPCVTDNIGLPDIYLCFYNNIIALDHSSGEGWIISTGFPAKDNDERVKNAKFNISEIKKYIDENINPMKTDYSSKEIAKPPNSNFTQVSYEKAVSDTREYILSGDIFEVNISQQFKSIVNENIDPLELYFKLAKCNPAPFSAFIKIPDNGYIISASPERFVKLTNHIVETCPIKGTVKRSKDRDKDIELANSLLLSEKDHAENVMIVDLMRNDLSKVCIPGSVIVEELCALKSFETVHHLVSKIKGELKEGMNSIDLLKATFPAGSITGAPKIRAMQIISELEMQARGPYCGCIGYLSFTGDMDTSVIIRAYFIRDNKIFFSAGGAIVLDSNPKEEYLESLIKAKALIEALSS